MEEEKKPKNIVVPEEISKKEQVGNGIKGA